MRGRVFSLQLWIPYPHEAPATLGLSSDGLGLPLQPWLPDRHTRLSLLPATLDPLSSDGLGLLQASKQIIGPSCLTEKLAGPGQQETNTPLPTLNQLLPSAERPLLLKTDLGGHCGASPVLPGAGTLSSEPVQRGAVRSDASHPPSCTLGGPRKQHSRPWLWHLCGLQSLPSTMLK